VQQLLLQARHFLCTATSQQISGAIKNDLSRYFVFCTSPARKRDMYGTLATIWYRPPT